MKNSKKSSSSAPVTTPIVTVAGSDLDVVANSNYLAYLKANVAAARLMGQQANDVLDDPDDDPINDPDDDPDDVTADDPSEGNDRPSLSDIEIVSNEVVFDSAGIPSAKIVFKVKNSSGKVLTAINSRVEKK
jgi:hypothetical protein